ncbi:MAG: hypothetical protein ACXWLR_11245, partial [Myxococcales bacterium]
RIASASGSSRRRVCWSWHRAVASSTPGEAVRHSGIGVGPSTTRQTAARAPAAVADPEEVARARDALRSGFKRLEERDRAGAAAQLRPAIESPSLASLEEAERQGALYARGVAALMLKDKQALTSTCGRPARCQGPAGRPGTRVSMR